MTLRVLFLSDYAAVGGGETSLLHLMEELARRDVEPVLQVPSEGRLTAMAEKKGIELEINAISRWRRAWLRDLPLYDPAGARTIQQLIRQHRIDLVHCNSPEHSLVHGAIAARRSHVPFVWTCHGPWERP
ncbi:MAG: glycosyltransferase, partial [Pseudomonadales bacterium]|nr:glycosyltransferase [Pseudomonadales bacterium]